MGGRRREGVYKGMGVGGASVRTACVQEGEVQGERCAKGACEEIGVRGVGVRGDECVGGRCVRVCVQGTRVK